LLVVCLIRALVYLYMHQMHWFYGIPWDTFARTLDSYNWSFAPFLMEPNGYWMPLQFYLEGTVFFLLRPWIPTSNLLVPVFINNVFFFGSLVITYLITVRLTGRKLIAFFACSLIAVFAGDVFITYSGLCEPMLIFFILLSSYLYWKYKNGEDKSQPNLIIWMAIASTLATLTHFLGMPIAFFFGILFVLGFFRALQKRDSGSLIRYGICILIELITPIGWLIYNYVTFGNPFYSFRSAQTSQQAYAGQFSIFKRIAIPFFTILNNYPAIYILIGIALLFLLVRTKSLQKLWYAIPGSLVFLSLWISSIFALSNTFQEPRYLVFMVWVCLPLVGVAGNEILKLRLGRPKGISLKALGVLAIILVLATNISQITQFKNYWSNDVLRTAITLKDWLKANNAQGKVVIQLVSPEQNVVIPTVSGYPYNYIYTDLKNLNLYSDDLGAFFNRVAKTSDPWIGVIFNDEPLTQKAINQGLKVLRYGIYTLIKTTPWY
jgi:4-amino-4-deoxy-L-arabinose transferase-like glycosyltransferase